MDGRWALSFLVLTAALVKAQEVPGFRFAHEVQQPSVGNYFGHSSRGKAGRTEGRYYVFLPDGRLMTVSYYADDTGYHPTISYSNVDDTNDLPAKDILKRRGGTTPASSSTTSGASETTPIPSLDATKDANQDIQQREESTTLNNPGKTSGSSSTTIERSGAIPTTSRGGTKNSNQDILHGRGSTTFRNPSTTSRTSGTTPTTSLSALKDLNQEILKEKGSTTIRNAGTTSRISGTTPTTSLNALKNSNQEIVQGRGSTSFRNAGTTSRISGTTPTTTVKESRAEILRRNEARRRSILQKSPRQSSTNGNTAKDFKRHGDTQTGVDAGLRNPLNSPTVSLTSQRTPEAPPQDTLARKGHLLARNPGNSDRIIKDTSNGLKGETHPTSKTPQDELSSATVEAPSLLAKELANGRQAQSLPANRVTRTLRPEVYISGDSGNALQSPHGRQTKSTLPLSQSRPGPSRLSLLRASQGR
ncbi:mucin-5AC-like [Portunus trituberculatus]|uniref:mucin-5AC-like n=1 Tax=Portunus trituberculatus TaxID=210409 RepID=UPI001E1CC39F|nr:mucin-5AC-like [Portunus trituberculatus]